LRCGEPQTSSHILSTPPQFDLSKLRCHYMLDADLTNRGYLVMLYWGYEAGEARKPTFVTATIRQETQALTDFCAQHPETLMMDAIDKVRAH